MDQAALKLSSGKIPTLEDVMIRPAVDAKRNDGTVQIHQNGIRFRARNGANVDILFSNMKHLIFQSCVKETLALIHIHLVHPIMMKKKVFDIQFYREVADAAGDDVSNRRQSSHRDDIEAEQEERKARRQLVRYPSVDFMCCYDPF